MADRFYGADKGGNLDSVSEGSSTTSKGIELRVDLSSGISRLDVLIALEQFEAYLNSNIWPPA